MFAALAVVFTISFVAFGVGSGSTGIGDLFRGNFPFFGGGGGGDSISKAQKAVAKHPTSAQAYRTLATALETKSRNDEAVLALARYTQLKPKDADALTELAGLYLRQTDIARRAAQVAQAAAQPVTGGALFGPSSTSKLGQALGSDPIVQAVGTKASQIVSDQYNKAQAAAAKAIDTYKRLARARPDDPSVQLELAQAAEGVGSTAVAIAAYRQFLKLAPGDPTAVAVKQRLKQLQPKK